MAVEVKDIKIYRSGRWHPMTNTRYFVNGAWKPFKAGDSIYHNGEWYRLTTKVDIVVYLAVSQDTDKEGNQTWSILVSTVPEVLPTYETEIYVDMVISMTNGDVHYVDGTVDGDNQSINTNILYDGEVEISNIQATATPSNTNYNVSNVVFTGMYSLRRSISEDNDELEEIKIEEEENEENTELSESE